MLRMTWGRLRRQRGRTLAVLAGILTAVTGFVVLTGSVSTQQARLTSFVQANSVGAYDILVRPAGSESEPERNSDLVRGNFLAGQYGGIGLAQWHRIQQLTGVRTAAPVAMLGYVPIGMTADVDVTAQVDPSLQQQLIKVSRSWLTDRGLTKIDDPGADYVYVTRNPVIWPTFVGTQDGSVFLNSSIEYIYQGRKVHIPADSCGTEPAPGGQGTVGVLVGTGVPVEALPDGTFRPICAAIGNTAVTATDRFSVANRSDFLVAHLGADGGFTIDHPFPGQQPVSSKRLDVLVNWNVMVQLAAIDPTAEDALVGLDSATERGSALADAMKPALGQSSAGVRGGASATVPVVLSDDSGLDEQLASTSGRIEGDLSGVYEQTAAAATAYAGASEASGAGHTTLDVQSVYASTVRQQPLVKYSGSYDQDSSAMVATLNPRYVAQEPTYHANADGSLSAVDLGAPNQNTWNIATYGESADVPAYVTDDAFRSVSVKGDTPGVSNAVEGVAVGTFNPAELKQFSSLSAVAMETFQSTSAAGADAASRQSLGGRSLTGNSSPGSYVATPPQLLTTMDALPYILDTGDPSTTAPISEIQVKVADVTGVDQRSRNRVAAVAAEIRKDTGLQVDIVAGSSPSPVTVRLPAGNHGRPALTLAELWSREGVAVALISAVDRKSLFLFVLVLIVCILFVGNAVSSSVRSRRNELAVLACLGWRSRRIALLVLGEVLLVALAAGVAGGVLARPLGAALGLHVGLVRAALAIPVALSVALAAAVKPAIGAGRTHPGAGLTPDVVAARRRRGGNVSGIRTLAWTAAGRTRWRTAAAVLALTLGIGATALLVCIEAAFHTAASQSLLADAVGVKVRGADVVAAVLTLTLAIAATADVLYLGIVERLGELASLRAAGWRDADIRRLVLWEGALISALGAVFGGLLGLAGTRLLLGEVPAAVYPALVVLGPLGFAATGAACLAPARLAARAPIARTLSEC
ncbi:FtsX-like permease family protein [Actinospica robiniae]|uniref:FtsX-like permease family protein n=1 Tax=Actinospica robiniae TaxID=304901 RepID=UPI00040CAA68|nr:FtsX-like permease family protein [Actinospica robiniae]